MKGANCIPSSNASGTERSAFSALVVFPYVAHYRESAFLALISAGREQGIEFHVAADATSNIPSIKVVDPLKFGSSWTTLRNHWLPANFLWQGGLLSLLRQRRPRVVIFLGDFHFLSTWVGALLVRFTGGSVFMWGHGFLRHQRGLIGVARMAFYRLAHKLLVFGDRARQILVDLGYPGDDVHVVYNSLDYATQRQVREELSLRSPEDVRAEMLGTRGGSVLMFSGRLVRTKGLELLFAALALLVQRGLDVNLVCVGDGPQRAEFENQATQLGLAHRIRFWGSCYDEDTLGRLFYMSDLTVSPGPIGLLAVHSLAYGTPVIHSDALDDQGPEFEAVEPGVTGERFRAGDAESLADTIAASLPKYRKPASMEACIRIVEKAYNPSNQAMLITAHVAAVMEDPRT